MNKLSLSASRNVILIPLALLGAVVIAYFSYEGITYEGLKNQCIEHLKQEGRNVSVYFEPSVNASIPTAFENEVSQIQNVESIKITSSEDALAAFKKRHEDDPATLEALDQLGPNPMGPSIVITFSNWKVVADSEGVIVNQIENLTAKYNLEVTKIDTRVQSTNQRVEVFQTSSFLSDVTSGGYFTHKKILERCATQESSI